MQVRLKLMGMFKSKTPPGGTMELQDGATIGDVLDALSIKRSHVHVVMVNGKHNKDHSLTLADEDELTVLSPVGGG